MHYTPYLSCLTTQEVLSPSQLVFAVLQDVSVAYQVPELILGNRMVHWGEADIAQILVKWSNMGAELATWVSMLCCQILRLGLGEA
jgi:hypothetical protein